ncbi:hypothetical protein LTS01_026087, partial [Friedmanniomyces endolithicus]
VRRADSQVLRLRPRLLHHRHPPLRPHGRHTRRRQRALPPRGRRHFALGQSHESHGSRPIRHAGVGR